jgi:hypothetical protein
VSRRKRGVGGVVFVCLFVRILSTLPGSHVPPALCVGDGVDRQHQSAVIAATGPVCARMKVMVMVASALMPASLAYLPQSRLVL